MDLPDLQRLMGPLEATLKFPSGMFQNLFEEKSDWSFVIKGHSLMEGAIANALSRAFRNAELVDVFLRLPTSDSKSGKAAFLRVMGIVPDYDLRFIQAFSELRNKLVHDVSNVEFSFKAHLAEATDAERRGYVRGFSGNFLKNLERDEDEGPESIKAMEEVLTKWAAAGDLRMPMMFGLLTLLCDLYHSVDPVPTGPARVFELSRGVQPKQ